MSDENKGAPCAGVSFYKPDDYPTPVRATYDASTDPVPRLEPDISGCCYATPGGCERHRTSSAEAQLNAAVSAALRGGVATVECAPNLPPPQDDPATALAAIRERVLFVEGATMQLVQRLATTSGEHYAHANVSEAMGLLERVARLLLAAQREVEANR